MTLRRMASRLGLPRETFDKARAVGELTATLRRSLPPSLADRCWAAGHDGSTLDIVVENGAWATEVRYLQREIVKRINEEHGLTLKRVHVRATPGRSAPPPPRHPLPPLPESASEALRATAVGVADPRLAAALERLARRAGRTNR